MITKPIPNYPGYFAREDGAILGKLNGNPLAGQVNGAGYEQVFLCNSIGKKVHRIHQIIARLFVAGEGQEINHKNGIKRDNRAENLEWTTSSKNKMHAYDIGLRPVGEANHLCTKLTEQKVREIRAMLAKGIFQRDIAKFFNISQQHVSRINSGKKWRQLK